MYVKDTLKSGNSFIGESVATHTCYEEQIGTAMLGYYMLYDVFHRFFIVVCDIRASVNSAVKHKNGSACLLCPHGYFFAHIGVLDSFGQDNKNINNIKIDDVKYGRFTLGIRRVKVSICKSVEYHDFEAFCVQGIGYDFCYVFYMVVLYTGKAYAGDRIFMKFSRIHYSHLALKKTYGNQSSNWFYCTII